MTAKIIHRNIRVGVVGIGHMGKYHINLLTKILPDQNIYIYDINETLTQKHAEEYNVCTCSSYEELLEYVEAVIIAVPTSLHYEYTMKAITKGRHVLVEKPISNNLDHAKEMISYAKENNIILHVGYVERFNGAVQVLRDYIKDPYYFQIQRIGSVSRIQDVGVVLDLMIHDIDILLSYVNSPIKDITAYGRSVVTNYEDYAIATIYFENGVIATLTASRISCHKIRSMNIAQENEYIYLDYATNDLLVYRKQDIQYAVSQEQITYKEGHMVDRVFVHKDNPLKLELEYFIDCITNNIEDDHPNGHSNLYTMEIIFRILEEIKKNNDSIKY